MKKIKILIGLIFLTICSFGQIKVVSEAVNLRSTPEITNNKIGTIPKGVAVTIVTDSEEYESWTKITYKEKSGYIKTAFLKEITTTNSNYSTASTRVKHYTNSNGVRVQSPTHYNSAPDGASAECYDGTYSFSQSRRGTCSHHGGVKRWL
jgi:uncharacterized protein YgiM (DUF1202 family)